MTKTQKILKYLQEHGTITSIEAFEKFRATRLSGIIFNLRHKYHIDTIMCESTDSNVKYARYIYKGEIENEM